MSESSVFVHDVIELKNSYDLLSLWALSSEWFVWVYVTLRKVICEMDESSVSVHDVIELIELKNSYYLYGVLRDSWMFVELI